MQLINIQAHETLQQAVDAKELYEKLGLHPAHWAKWHTKNIAENPFAEANTDYVTFTQEVRGNQTQNYALSIDFAKKLAMQVKTDKGEEVRNYFLECERKANAAPAFAIPQSFAEALQLAADQALKIEQDAPKVNAYDKLIDTTNLKTVGDVAKSIGLKSAQQLNAKLDAIGAYDKRCKRREWAGWFVEKGYGQIRTTDDGWTTSKMTAKGQAWALDLFGV